MWDGKLMGVLNVTEDSFSDGGRFLDVDDAMRQVDKMVSEGVGVIDVGGESSGPGSKFVSLEEEISRVVPLVEKIREKYDGETLEISVDTYKAEVARQALIAGATMINDVTGLRGDSEMLGVLRDSDCEVVIMYSKDDSARTTIEAQDYMNVVEEVGDFLEEKVEWMVKEGIDRSRIIVDPGMGHFVSSVPRYSYELIAGVPLLKERLGCKVLLGISRKSLLGGSLEERDVRGLSLQGLAAVNQTDILRVHNVGILKKHLEFMYGN